MSLAAGTRLGPYEVLSPLGAGGMGEVYRARDSRLAREVALKVLPEELALDRERLNRFEQEARAASALNHPNIVTVYDVGRAEATSFIAMELVEGKTVRELLVSGPVSVKRALSIAAQAADGLAKAHGAGIVHRDLKPENLMVSSDGFVKILDFGLAKLVAERPGGLSDALTLAGSQTASGVILGTVGYMSPEQTSAAPLDFRSDQFSLGAILYEMVTGKRAFTRATVVDTLSAILHEEPEPIAAVRPETPGALLSPAHVPAGNHSLGEVFSRWADGPLRGCLVGPAAGAFRRSAGSSGVALSRPARRQRDVGLLLRRDRPRDPQPFPGSLPRVRDARADAVRRRRLSPGGPRGCLLRGLVARRRHDGGRAPV